MAPSEMRLSHFSSEVNCRIRKVFGSRHFQERGNFFHPQRFMQVRSTGVAYGKRKDGK
jgi:hypothetical protein